MLHQIYAEGFVITGQRGVAHLAGHMVGDTFEEACAKFYKNDKNYNPVKNTVWGCKLFNNFDDARKNYG